MESLNLNTLANSLPNSNMANAEKDLMNDFKAAALSITTLYRSSRTTSKRAYNAGYAAACQDMLQVIQQGVSDSESEGGSGMPTIGRVMDYIEARLEAIRAREEEEEEDEEREKVGAAKAPSVPINRPSSAPVPQHKDSNPLSAIPRLNHANHSSPPTPSPTAPTPTPPQRPLLSRATKSRPVTSSPLAPVKQPIAVPTSTFPFDFSSPITTESVPVASTSALPVAAGAKRRHAVMMMLDADSAAVDVPNVSSGPSTRRRTKSQRERGGSTQAQSQTPTQAQNQTQSALNGDAMDVEEEGRERKRVARR